MTNHPIIPPPELVQCFLRSNPVTPTGMTYEQFIATRFAQWGADQELEACVKLVSEYCPYFGDYPLPEDKLRATRRPKPPSLKEEALAVLDHTQKGYGLAEVDLDTIRRALEALDD